MSYIKVDYSKFEMAAAAVDNYIKDMKKSMINAEREVLTLSSAWQGQDFNQFRNQWNKVTDNDSTYTKMVRSLEAYAKFLRYASNQYKNAQFKAVNRANSLPK